MRVVVDTCVWSLALARHTPSDTPAAVLLRRLIEEGQEILVPGIVLQELLQGLRSDSAVARLTKVLEPFDLIAGEVDDLVRGAAIHRACRKKGLGIATIDAHIAAIAMRRDAAATVRPLCGQCAAAGASSSRKSAWCSGLVMCPHAPPSARISQFASRPSKEPEARFLSRPTAAQRRTPARDDHQQP